MLEWCIECGLDKFVYDHTVCEEIIRRKNEGPLGRDKHAMTLERNPWMHKFLDNYAIWEEKHPNSKS